MKINKWEQIHDLESDTRLVCKFEESSLTYNNYHVDILVDGLQETSFELYRGHDLGDCVYLLSKIGFDVEYDKPFNLIEFLTKYIKPVDIQDSLNCCFLFNCCFLVNNDGEISVQKSVTDKVVGGFYFDVRYIEACLKLEAILHNNKITSEQLEGALKKLNWIQ